MKTAKKLLAAFLATVFLVSAATMWAYAAPQNSPDGIVKTIDRVDITLRTDIAGKSSWDYKDIYTIETKHVKYHDNGMYSGNPAIGIYDKNGFISDYNKKLVMGESYQFCFWLVADQLYKFSNDCKVYVNGKVPEHYSLSFGQDDSIDIVGLYTMNFSDRDWLTVTAQPGSCKYCGDFHTGFFGKIIGFFHTIFALFGLHK